MVDSREEEATEGRESTRVHQECTRTIRVQPRRRHSRDEKPKRPGTPGNNFLANSGGLLGRQARLAASDGATVHRGVCVPNSGNLRSAILLRIRPILARSKVTGRSLWRVRTGCKGACAVHPTFRAGGLKLPSKQLRQPIPKSSP